MATNGYNNMRLIRYQERRPVAPATPADALTAERIAEAAAFLQDNGQFRQEYQNVYQRPDNQFISRADYDHMCRRDLGIQHEPSDEIHDLRQLVKSLDNERNHLRRTLQSREHVTNAIDDIAALLGFPRGDLNNHQKVQDIVRAVYELVRLPTCTTPLEQLPGFDKQLRDITLEDSYGETTPGEEAGSEGAVERDVLCRPAVPVPDDGSSGSAD